MVRGHCSFLNFALKTIADDEFVSFAPFAHEARNFREIVAAIRVTHDDEFAAGVFNAFAQCAAVAFQYCAHDPSAVLLRDCHRSVAGTVVSHHNFSRNTGIAESGYGFIYAESNRARLVQARDDNRHFDLMGFGRLGGVPSLRTRLVAEAGL